MLVDCDICRGARCAKCGWTGRIELFDAVRPARTLAGALVWYGILGLAIGGLLIWVLRGCK